MQPLKDAIDPNGDTYRSQIDARLAGMEMCLKKKIDFADFVWAIDKLTQRANDTLIESDYFIGSTERYKMRLSCDWRGNSGKEVRLYLRIYFGENDAFLRWPFERRVTIIITNKDSPHVHRGITNLCRIGKPTSNYRSSDPFTFMHSELFNAGLLLGNCMAVQCTIHEV